MFPRTGPAIKANREAKMNQELQERIQAAKQELQQIQNEFEDGSLPYLVVDMAVSAVIMAWHFSRNDPWLARHNWDNVTHTIETVDFMLYPDPTE